MTQTSYRHAITRALADALAADPDVFVLGEDVGAAGGVFKTTDGLFAEFGPERVLDTPISETAIVGAAIGAALRGLRPVAEIMFADFAGVCYDQIANQLAKYRYMTGGQANVPVTIRLANGGGLGFAAQHSQPVENWFLNTPGIKIAVPATPRDAYGLLRAAIADPDPVLVFEHKALFERKGEMPDTEPAPVPLGTADIARAGRDITVVATQLMRWRALEAAEILAADGIEAEVIDPRTLVPFDETTVFASVARTSRLVCVQDSPASGSWGASLIARVAENCFEKLDAPPTLICAVKTPIPYAATLESAWLPSADRIVSEVRALASY
jgi:acetoin:2,6-dichlorophenolindophenol oxidoreductase subunit beta